MHGKEWPLVFMSVLFLGALVEGSWLYKMCRWPPIKALGAVSYSAYLLHFLVLELMYRYADGIADLKMQFAVFLLLTFGVSAVTYFAIEKPFLKMRERFLLS